MQTAGGVTLAVAEADLKDYAGMHPHAFEGAPHVSRLAAVALRRQTSNAHAGETLMLRPAPYGGYAAHFSPTR